MSTLRFTPNAFLYNGRVALALVPGLIVAGALGGSLVMGVLTVGCMVAYILDALQYREGAFTAVWSTLALSDIGLVVNLILKSSDRPVLLTAASILMMGALFLLTGMWATLQFKWIQMQYPAVAVVFERQVVVASIPVAAVVQAVGIASLVEVADVPYYLAAILLVLYHFLARPLVSSFHSGRPAATAMGGSKTTNAVAIQTKGDAFLLYVVTVALPFALYTALHLPVLLEWLHISSLMLLGAVPVVYLCAVEDGMWWLPGGRVVTVGLRRMLLVAAAAVALVGFEGRVIFHSFGQYIQLHAPYNYLAVTLALAGFAAVFVAHVSGYLEQHFDVALAGTAMLLCTTAGGLAAGIPLQWLPAPLVAACGLALYYDSGSLREYSIFVAGALLTGIWFVRHHFWFLDIAVGIFHLHIVCKLALSALVPALLVPGLVTSNAPRAATGALLVFQALCISLLEEQLYVPSHQELAGEAMYPPYLVIATSALGLAAARKLMALSLIPRTSYWLLLSTYGAKLFMLALPEAYLVMPLTLLLLAATAPLFLYKDSGPRARLRLAPWQVLLHALACLLALALARFAVFDLVQWLLMSRPPEGLLLGCLVLTGAASLVPLVMRCMPGNQGAQRALAALALAGVLLILLRPPLPVTGSTRCPRLPLALCPRLWDQRHIPMHESDDVAIWGVGMARREHWPKWLLLAACMAGVTSIAGPASLSNSVLARLVLGTGAGLLVGGYLALEVVPGQQVLQVLLVASSMLVVAFVALLLAPLQRTPSMLPFVGILWAASFATTMVLQSVLAPPEPSTGVRLFPDNQLLAEAEREAAMRSSLLGVFAAHALLLAFTIKLKISSVLRSSDSSKQQVRFSLNGGFKGMPDYKQLYQTMDFFCGVVPSNVFSSFGKMLHLEGAAQVTMQRLASQGLAWAPSAGNLFTLLAFAICVALNAALADGQPEAIFMLAPLLLLLSRDPLLLRFLGEAQRYAPPVTAASLYLAGSTLVRIYADLTGGSGAGGLSLASASVRLAALAAALPLHALFLRFLWQQKPCPGVVLLLLSPLCLAVPLVYSPYAETRYLAIAGPVLAVLQHLNTRHKRQVGMKVI